ncbi:MAG: universal stress protein [bacterium]
MFKKKVLLATDFSETALKLMNCLEELKKLGVEQVLLVHVVDIHSAKLDAGELQKADREKLEEVKKEIEQMGFEVEVEVPIGGPVAEINRLAESEDVGVILVASHGRGPIKRIALGSTTHNLLRRTNCPLLVEKYKNIDCEGDVSIACARKFDRIFVATDLSEPSARVTEMIKKIEAPAQEIILATFFETSSDAEQLREDRKITEERMESIRDELLASDAAREVSIIIGEGEAADNIISAAREHQAGLIMIGSHGRGGLKELLLGSTAETVAQKSSIPVLLVPNRES